MGFYREEFEKSNSKMLDVFTGADNSTFMKYLFNMRDYADKADLGGYPVEEKICDIVNNMARLLEAFRDE